MGIIIRNYHKQSIHRYDDLGYIKYFNVSDFPNLLKKEITFTSCGNLLHGYFYNYPNPTKENLVIFCHGLGGGHLSYMKEIELICKQGYTVFSYDVTGCFSSSGKDIRCLSQSLVDLDNAIKYLKDNNVYNTYKGIFVIGHSWGGYASCNIGKFHNDIKKIVDMSGFVSVNTIINDSIPKSFIKKMIVKKIMSFEKKQAPRYFDANITNDGLNPNIDYLFVQSTDDFVVPFKSNIGLVKNKYPNSSFIIFDNKGHQPSYTVEGSRYLNEVFNNYNKLLKEKKIKTLDEKKEYFSHVDWDKATEQDTHFWNQVFEFFSE